MQTINGTNKSWKKLFREHPRGFPFTVKLVKENELPYRYYRKENFEISNPWWKTANKSFLI